MLRGTSKDSAWSGLGVSSMERKAARSPRRALLRPGHLGWLADESLCGRIRREIVSSQSKCGDDLSMVSNSGVSGPQAAGPEMFRARKRMRAKPPSLSGRSHSRKAQCQGSGQALLRGKREFCL